MTDITWRSTTVRALPNNMIIVPNAKLAQAIVTNYYLPEKRMSLPILIGVSYDSDPEQIERIFKRFREERIEIPFPIRTVYLRSEPSNRGITTTRNDNEPVLARKSF